MNIETGKTPTEQEYLSFKSKYNEKITLVAQGEQLEQQLRCAIREDGDTSMHAPFTYFTRDEVKAILPYLQVYAETGSLELQESPLKGEEINSIDVQIAYAAVIEDPKKRIEALEQLLREWKKYGQPSFDSKSPDEQAHLTEQLLGEDH